MRVGEIMIKKMIERDEKYKKYIPFASHAIGLDHKEPYKRHGRYFYKPYRNYYDASEENSKVWDSMVADGFAKAGKKDRHGGRMYWLTRKGLDWLGEQLGIVIHNEDE